MTTLLTVIFLLCLGAVVIYFLQNRTQDKDRTEIYRTFLGAIAANLRRNIEKLEAGDVGWRRLGHGQSTIGLKKVAPKKADVISVSLERVRHQYPDIVEGVEAIDRDIELLQAAANRLSTVLEEPVREQFHADRNMAAENGTEGERQHFRKWLLDREDAWMELLANLINDGETLTKKGDPGALYWEHTRPSYLSILDAKGGQDLEDLQRLKSKIADRSKALLEDVEVVLGDA